MTEELKDNAVLYVLGQLDDAEQAEFIEALRSEPDLPNLVNEYREVLAAVSLSVENQEPDTMMRNSILAAIRQNEEVETPSIPGALPSGRDLDPEAGEKSPGNPFRRTVILPWALAACLAICCVTLVMQTFRLRQENAELVQAAHPENLRIASLAAQTEELPDLGAQVAWNANTGTGILETESFPSQPDTRTYQLWIFEKDNPAPVSAGVFDPTSKTRVVFQPERPVTEAVAFAVSIEVAGGRPQPEGPVILVGAVQEG